MCWKSLRPLWFQQYQILYASDRIGLSISGSVGITLNDLIFMRTPFFIHVIMNAKHNLKKPYHIEGVPLKETH
jgi:hypothetical protein